MSAAAPTVTKFVREYQPVDKNGLAIGPKQRFEADTLEELVDKIASAHQSASANLYETKRAAKLGDLLTKEDENDDPVYDFVARPLTADERLRLSKEITDPEKGSKALETAVEALFGAPLEAVRSQLRENSIAKMSEKARATVDEFIGSHPEYVPSQSNQTLLIKYMEKHNLRFNKKNLESAYQDLRSADLLTVQAPRPAEPIKVETPTVPVAAVPAVTEPATPPAPAIPATVTQPPSNNGGEPLRPAQSSSGLSRNDGGTQPPPAPAKTQGITINDITRLPADQYAEALRDGLYEYATVKDPNTGRSNRVRGKQICTAKEFSESVDKLLGGK